jgi:hypothetical protein
MKKLKLSKLPDRVPVKLQITLAPDLAARLRDYADLYEQTYGVREEPAELVPFMLEAFLSSDPEFRRMGRAKSAMETESKVPGARRPSLSGREGEPGPPMEGLRKPIRPLGPQSEPSSL